MATSDNAGRVRVGPRDKVTFWDAVWPHRHGKWWNWDAEQQRTENADDLLARMPTDDLDDVQDILRRVESVAQTAVDRAEATERRATTITGSVAIAASFTVGGAGLLLDDAKWNGVAPLRVAFAVVLSATTLLFVLAAVYALRALVSKKTRTWNWMTTTDLWKISAEPTRERRFGREAARRLDRFAGNWEIADLKIRNVDNALRCLIGALVGLTALAVIAAAVAF